MITIQPGAVPQRHPQVAARTIDDQAVIILADSGNVTILNPVGTRVWDLIDGIRSVSDILTVITREYEVTPEEAQTDVYAFLTDLTERGAISF